MSGEGESDGDDDGALRQLSQDQGRLPLVRSLYSPIVSPEQTLWTQWSPLGGRGGAGSGVVVGELP